MMLKRDKPGRWTSERVVYIVRANEQAALGCLIWCVNAAKQGVHSTTGTAQISQQRNRRVKCSISKQRQEGQCWYHLRYLFIGNSPNEHLLHKIHVCLLPTIIPPCIPPTKPPSARQVLWRLHTRHKKQELKIAEYAKGGNTLQTAHLPCSIWKVRTTCAQNISPSQPLPRGLLGLQQAGEIR